MTDRRRPRAEERGPPDELHRGELRAPESHVPRPKAQAPEVPPGVARVRHFGSMGILVSVTRAGSSYIHKEAHAAPPSSSQTANYTPKPRQPPTHPTLSFIAYAPSFALVSVSPFALRSLARLRPRSRPTSRPCPLLTCRLFLLLCVDHPRFELPTTLLLDLCSLGLPHPLVVWLAPVSRTTRSHKESL